MDEFPEASLEDRRRYLNPESFHAGVPQMGPTSTVLLWYVVLISVTCGCAHRNLSAMKYTLRSENQFPYLAELFIIGFSDFEAHPLQETFV